ncbi:MAG: YfbR-like 5'-deoxynucleotidase [Candidatus Uhrbacteria bacterium]
METGKSMLATLQQRFDAITRGMKSVTRWKPYPNRGRQDEDVCEHTVQQTMLVQLLLVLEREYGNMDGLDGERLLGCALMHDMGEGLIGDVSWMVKQDPRIGPLLEEKEREAFDEQIVSAVPEAVGIELRGRFDIQHELDTRAGRFFNASEFLGYVLRAVFELQSGDEQLAREVFIHQYFTLLDYGKEFASIARFCADLAPIVEPVLLSDAGREYAVLCAAQKHKPEILKRLDAFRKRRNGGAEHDCTL